MNTDSHIHWLGLASYEEKDASIFYGREDEIAELSGDIFHNTQTIIYGPSGTGKTSLLKAGIFRKARENGFFPVYIRLNHDSGEAYAGQVIREVCTQAAAEKIDVENRIGYITPERLSLWEFFHCNIFWNTGDFPVTPLVVIDQFEEIFTLAKAPERVDDFFGQLSDLCDDRMPAYIRQHLAEGGQRVRYPEKVDYRCVLALREDFLARLEEYAARIPALKRNRYSLQAIHEKQAMDIIIRPSQGIVAEEVALEIVRKVTNRKEVRTGETNRLIVEPALLSLFCHELDRKREERRQEKITAALVEEFGDNIIKNFYRETIRLVSPATGNYLEDRLLTSDGFRDRVSLRDALNRGVVKEELDILQKNRLIRIEEWDGAKRIEFTHDVLCKVAAERRNERAQQLRVEAERQRVRRLRKRVYLFAAVIVLLLLLIGGYIVGFLMPYSEYYESFVYRQEWPEGINRLSRRQAEHWAGYTELSRKGMFPAWWTPRRGAYARHWTRAVQRDAWGDVSPGGDGTLLVNPGDEEDSGVNENFKSRLQEVCRYEFIADAGGLHVMQVKAYNKRDEPIWCGVYTGYHIREADARKGWDYTYLSYTDKNGLPVQSRKNGASVVKISFDACGYRKSVEFFDAFGNRAKNGNLAYAEKYEYSPDGLLLRFGSARPGGGDSLVYCLDKAGNSGWRYEYENKRIIKGISVDGNGKISPVADGYAVCTYAYDSKGRHTTTCYFDGNGEKFEYYDREDYSFYHSFHKTLDDRGNTVKLEFLGMDSELTRRGCAYRKFYFKPETNLVIKELSYRYDGSYWEGNGGAGYEARYDDPQHKAWLTGFTCLKDSVTPAVDSDGVYTTEWKYDSRGNKLAEFYYDAVHSSMTCHEGYAGIVMAYDEEDRLVKKEYLDKEHRPSYALGYACVKYRYDDRGNLVAEEYYDEKGDRYMTPDGVASEEYRYDLLNNRIQTVWKDADGKRLESKVIWVNAYDAFGNQVETACYDMDGKTPVNNASGWHREVMKYDDNHFQTEQSYWDKDGRRIDAPEHRYAICRFENDGGNRIKSCAYYDVYDRPCLSEEGYHRQVNTLRFGRIVRQEYFGVDGQPCAGPEGAYAGTCEYDYRGNLIRMEVLGQNGEPMNNRLGYAFVSYEYDIYNHRICEAYYDKDGKPCLCGGYFKLEAVYEDGRLVLERKYRDEQHLLADNPVVRYVYNGNGQQSDICYLDTGMNPVDNREGWSRCHKEYRYGRLWEETYFDKTGKPCEARRAGLAYCRKEYHYIAGRENGATVWDIRGHAERIEPYEGYGVKVYPNGNRMAGNWSAGKINDWGTYRFNSGMVYRGYLENGIFSGKGTLSRTDGTRIEGNFVNDLPEGEGVEYLADGTVFRGNFSKGQKEGTGVYYEPDGTIRAAGVFVDGRLQYTYCFKITDLTNEMLEHGLQRGDLLIDFDDFHYFVDDWKYYPPERLQAKLGKVLKQRAGTHELLVARPEGREYDFIRVTLRAEEVAEYIARYQLVGLEIQRSVTDFGHLDRLYRSYMHWKVKNVEL